MENNLFNDTPEVKDNKARFIEIFKTKITREGSDKLLQFLLSPHSDFFTAPASSRFHSSYEGGLLDHSLNVYDCLVSYMNSEKAKKLGFEYSEESLAIVALLHDLCTPYLRDWLRNSR